MFLKAGFSCTDYVCCEYVSIIKVSCKINLTQLRVDVLLLLHNNL